jgi:hypothetical protein
VAKVKKYGEAIKRGINPSKYRRLRGTFYLKGEHLWAGSRSPVGHKQAATCDLNPAKGERLWGWLGEESMKGERIWGGKSCLGGSWVAKVNGYGADGLF